MGVLQARYVPAATARPVQWRVVNPEVPSFIAGSGTHYSQVPGGLVLCTEGRISEELDLATGLVREIPGLEQTLREADPAFRRGDVADAWFGYRDLRVMKTQYYRDGDRTTWVTQILAFRGDHLVGRIELAKGKITVFKGGEKSSETESPWKNAYMFAFPQSVQEILEPTNAEVMDGFDDIWRKARYADLFCETLRTDGALSEQISVILGDRFDADPAGFIRALARAPQKQVDRVGYLLAYNADYGDLGAFRRKVEGLKQGLVAGVAEGTSTQGEVDAVDRLLERIDRFGKR